VELMQQIEEKFGEQVHIIDWALHLDEATPHIHERHVFDCDNSYGEKCPQQEKALEMLGFQLPDPDKKKGRNNNRKMSFDAECRKMFFEICDKYGLQLDKNPEYGGRDYLEKQDFIIENQKRKMETQEQALEQISMKLEDAEALVDEIAENAYQKACEIVTEVVSEETRKKDIEAVSEYRNWYNKPERKVTPDQRKLANKILEHVETKLNGLAKKILKKVQEVLQSPAVKEQSQNEIKEHAKRSLREHIKLMKQKSAEQDKDRKSTDLPKNKQQNIGIE
ncbi:MAG: serine/arginine repetitive matrix protein 2, partial [Lachnospiraceae bacterium]|nr:serine/arginine repetitive matrix protein 2 [Lachnospiraceae bacterium]